MAKETDTPEIDATTPAVEKTDATESVQPFKAFATEAEYRSFLDREKQQAVKANEANAAKKAEDAAKKAQMTAEQKLSAQLDEINAQLNEVHRGQSELASKEELNNMGLSAEDYVEFLPYIVTTNEEETRSKAAKIGAKLLEKANALAQKQVQKTMRDVDVPAGTLGQEVSTDESRHAELTKRLTEDPKNSKLQQEWFRSKEALRNKG
jgi:hypothetical protein